MKNRLKELRKTRKWSQADLARALEISRQAINGFESGKFTPSLEMAFKIARLFDVAIEEVFIYQEKNTMQMLIENLTQWLPKGEKFTVKALKAIASAQENTALSERSQVEPDDLLYGLLKDSSTTAARLLKNYGLHLDIKSRNDTAKLTAPKINKFSPESQYVFELALQSARLENRKYIETEDLLWGLLQLLQKGDFNLSDLFKQYEVDLQSLTNELKQLNN
ncbi:MAG: helix-turn-helix domain-containing protein [Cyanobacteria bacterium P01_C01_bin.72]